MLRLVRPDKEYLASYAEAFEEELRLSAGSAQFHDPAHVLEDAARLEAEQVPEGAVRMTVLWLVEGSRFIGEVEIRHKLTTGLRRYGGHIGYGVRITERNRGYGTKLLKFALQYARDELGLPCVLITCDESNSASIRVIEKNGGILQDKVNNHTDHGMVVTRRYWIALTQGKRAERLDRAGNNAEMMSVQILAQDIGEACTNGKSMGQNKNDRRNRR